MPIEVLHVIQRLSRGGAGHALLALAGEPGHAAHRVVSLVAAEPSALALAAKRSIPVLDAPTPAALDRAAAECDIVQVHFWNTPELYDFMTTPRAARVVLWSHVNGRTPPHIVTPALATYADAVVGTADTLSGLDDLVGGPPRVIQPSSPAAIAPRRPSAGADGFTVGILGTLDSSRTDADALRVFATAALPGSRLIVVGDGNLLPRWREQARVLGLAERVEFTGYVDDVADPLRRMDVLLHMPRPGGFATADLAVQEAMTAGVVPVVMGGTAVTDLLRNGQDGLVGADHRECVEHLRSLSGDGDLLERLSDAARVRAASDFTPQACARAFDEVYSDVAARPKVIRWVLDPGPRGVDRFLASLGDASGSFRVSAGREQGWQWADDQIAASPPALVGAGAGGILHYRGYYPDDPVLRYWAGLVFANAGRTALAAAEFSAAAAAGFPGAAERLDRLRSSPSPMTAAGTP